MSGAWPLPAAVIDVFQSLAITAVAVAQIIHVRNHRLIVRAGLIEDPP